MDEDVRDPDESLDLRASDSDPDGRDDGLDDEMALKILHTADWHLGAKFLPFDPEDRLKLTRARLDCVEGILSVAEQTEVDAVLVAGDIFDDHDPPKEWWQGLAAKLARRDWRDRPLVLLPGNHDPIMAGSVFHRDHPFRAQLPPYVHVVEQEGFELPLGADAVLYANPCTKQSGELDLALRLPERAPGDERIRIGMVHGTTFDMPGYQQNFPISKEAPQLRGLDYLAIGDTHAHKVLPEEGVAQPIVYPGTPEQLTWGERRTGMVSLVFFRRRGRRPTIRPQRVARWTWRKETVRSLDELRELCETQDLKQTVLKLTFELRATPEAYQQVERLIEQLAGTAVASGRAGVLQVERDGLELDTAGVELAFEDLPEVIQATARRLAAAAEDEVGDTEVARQALNHLYRLARGG